MAPLLKNILFYFSYPRCTVKRSSIYYVGVLVVDFFSFIYSLLSCDNNYVIFLNYIIIVTSSPPQADSVLFSSQLLARAVRAESSAKCENPGLVWRTRHYSLCLAQMARPHTIDA